MSGGHFDYQQYHIDDIANSIEKEIEEAAKPKPPLVWREGVSVFRKIDDWHYVGIYKGFNTYDEAVRHLKKDKAYKFVREYEKDGKRISEFMEGDKLIEVKEIKYQEYEDGEYHPEYTEETIQIFKDAVKTLRKAAIYAQRIDWLLSGDDGEESLKERLEEELKELEDEKMKKKEFAVGEVFQLGLFKLKVTERDGCFGCFFAQNHIVNCIKLVGPCNPNSREDKTSVIFVEVEEEECKR